MADDLKIKLSDSPTDAPEAVENQLSELKLEAEELKSLKDALKATFDKDKDGIIEMTKEKLTQLINTLREEKSDEDENVGNTETYDGRGDNISAKEIDGAIDKINESDIPPAPTPDKNDTPEQTKTPNTEQSTTGLGSKFQVMGQKIAEKLPFGLGPIFADFMKNIPRMINDFITGLKLTLSRDKLKTKENVIAMASILSQALRKNSARETAKMLDESLLSDKVTVFDAMREIPDFDLNEPEAAKDMQIFLTEITKGIPDNMTTADLIEIIRSRSTEYGDIIKNKKTNETVSEEDTKKKAEVDAENENNQTLLSVKKIEIEKDDKKTLCVHEKIDSIVKKDGKIAEYPKYDAENDGVSESQQRGILPNTFVTYNPNKTFAESTIWEIKNMQELKLIDKDAKNNPRIDVINRVSSYFDALSAEKQAKIANKSLKDIIAEIEKLPAPIAVIPTDPNNGATEQKEASNANNTMPLNPKENLVFLDGKLYQWNNGKYGEMKFVDKKLGVYGSDKDMTELPEEAECISYADAQKILENSGENFVDMYGWMLINKDILKEKLRPAMGPELFPRDGATVMIGKDNKIYKWHQTEYKEITKDSAGNIIPKAEGNTIKETTENETYGNFIYAITLVDLKSLTNWGNISNQIKPNQMHMFVKSGLLNAYNGDAGITTT